MNMKLDAANPAENSTSFWVFVIPWAFVILWSGGFAFAKIGLQYAEPLTFLALRYLVLVGILALVFLIVRPPLPKTKREWRDQVVVGFFIQALYFILTYFAFIYGVSAGTFGIIVAFQPIIVGILAGAVAGETVSRTRWIGIGIGLMGAFVTIYATSSFTSASIVGLVSSFGALFGMTAGTLYEKRYGSQQHPVTANFIQYGVGLLVCAPFALSMETMQINWTVEFVIALSYLVIANSLIAITLLLAMIRMNEVSRVSSLFYLVPPTAAIGAWLLIDEVMPPLAWLGMAIAVIGVALAGGMAIKPKNQK